MFSLLEITSGLPDDSREAEEREAERRLHDLRARVTAARAAIAATPELAEVLTQDATRAARFYARFGVTEGLVTRGVSPGSDEEAAERVWWPADRVADLESERKLICPCQSRRRVDHSSRAPR